MCNVLLSIETLVDRRPLFYNNTTIWNNSILFQIDLPFKLECVCILISVFHLIFFFFSFFCFLMFRHYRECVHCILYEVRVFHCCSHLPLRTQNKVYNNNDINNKSKWLQWFFSWNFRFRDWNWMAQGRNEWIKYACRIGIMRINTSGSHWINKKQKFNHGWHKFVGTKL